MEGGVVLYDCYVCVYGFSVEKLLITNKSLIVASSWSHLYLLIILQFVLGWRMFSKCTKGN